MLELGKKSEIAYIGNYLKLLTIQILIKYLLKVKNLSLLTKI